MQTLQISQQIDRALNDMTHNGLQLEKDNAMLKQALRIMMGNLALTEDGDTTIELTDTEVNFLKHVCDSCNIFNVLKEKEGLR